MRRDIPPDMLRADWHLRNWAMWCRRYRPDLGYPDKSAGLESGGVSGEDAFDLLCADADRVAAEWSDAAIESLDIIYQCVLHYFYLAAVFRFRGDPAKMLDEAMDRYWEEAMKRGLC